MVAVQPRLGQWQSQCTLAPWLSQGLSDSMVKDLRPLLHRSAPWSCHGLQGTEATLTGLRKHPFRVTYSQGRDTARVGGGREEPCRQWEHPRAGELGAVGVEKDEQVAGT